MNQTPDNHEDPRLAAMLEVIFKYAAGDLTARGSLSEKDDALDGVMAGINILGEELEAKVAENKRAIDALRAKEKSYQLLFESSRDALMTLAPPSWRYTSANQATLELFGASSTAAFTELAPWNVSPERQPDGRASEEKAQEEIATAMREGKNFFEWEHQRLDGSPFPADVLLTRMVVAGEVFLQATVRNITDRKRAEQALSESDTLLRTIFDTVQDGIILAEAQSRKFRMVNDSICRMLGYSRDELLELGVEDIHPEKDIANVARQIERQIKREISLAPSLPVKRKDGTVFYADINATPMQVKGESFLVGVFRDITERKRAEQAEELATRDSLTNLYNHRTFYSLLKDEIARTQRFKRPVSLLILDIDHFKRVNDTHGHQAGDAIIKGLSDLQVKQARAVDRVCRYGGEEFMVILPETDATMAMQIAERLRAAVERQPFDIGGGKMVRITVSIGVATYPQQANALEELVKAADVALYAAKEGGRNRVTRYEATMAGKDSSV